MGFTKSVLTKIILTQGLMSMLLLCALVFGRTAHAQWLTLYTPQQTPVAPPTAIKPIDYNVGRDAFNAFGCGECHSDLAEQGYRSGFRMIESLEGDAEREGAQKAGLAVSDLQTQLLPARSPSVSSAVKALVLGGQQFIPSTRYDSVFLRRAHRALPFETQREALHSVELFDAASAQQQEASLDYMLMF
ncbi:hypothetical protein [Marinagarivorans algicola]|uniref:hypothetical protein n=1 Tax=Marinagarivorans algicola TaxID=1513270 RepID=UPI0012E1E65D|nr:hypothetical protein [Marinagarivorans algicola]